MVDRSNAKSDKLFLKVHKKRIESGLSICIFPEGGVPEESITLDRFKIGAFRLAVDHKLPLVPITFFDNKTLVLYFFSGSPGKMRAIGHSFLNPEKYKRRCKKNEQ